MISYTRSIGVVWIGVSKFALFPCIFSTVSLWGNLWYQCKLLIIVKHLSARWNTLYYVSAPATLILKLEPQCGVGKEDNWDCWTTIKTLRGKRRKKQQSHHSSFFSPLEQLNATGARLNNTSLLNLQRHWKHMEKRYSSLL